MKIIVLMALGIFTLVPAFTQETLVPLWTVVTGGRILGDPVISDDEKVFVLSEDKKLYCIDRTGKTLFTWSNGDRFQKYLTLSDGGRLTLITLSNQVICLNVLPKTGPEILWSFHLDSELSCPPARDFYGNLILGTQRGGLYAISNFGQMLWSNAYDSPPTSIITHGGIALYVLFDKTFRGLDGAGNNLIEVQNRGHFSQLLMNSQGRIILWGSAGYEVLTPEGEVEGGYRIPGGGINQVLLDNQENLVLFHNSGLTVMGPLGQLRKQWPGKASFNGLITESGVLSLETEKLSFVGKKTFFKVAPLNRNMGLGEKGLLVLGGDDWIIYGFQCAAPWAGPWPQSGGGSLKHYQITPSVDERSISRLYEKNWDYVYLMKKAASRDSQSQEEVLNEIENKLKTGTLKSDWPFADLLLVRIALNGIVFVDSPAMVGKNNYPLNRARAYGLLGRFNGPRVRYLLLEGLQKEFDPYALRNAVAAFGQLAYDYDGAGSRSLKIAQDRFPGDEALAKSLIGAVKGVIKFNRRITDGALGDILTRIFQGSFSTATKQEAQKAFQYLISGDY